MHRAWQGKWTQAFILNPEAICSWFLSQRKEKLVFNKGGVSQGFWTILQGRPHPSIKANRKSHNAIFWGFCLLFHNALCGIFFLLQIFYIYFWWGVCPFCVKCVCFIDHMCFLCFFLAPPMHLTSELLFIFSYSGLFVFILSNYIILLFFMPVCILMRKEKNPRKTCFA